MKKQTHFVFASLAHPQQDVHKERKLNPSLRYKVAEGLLKPFSQRLSVLEIGGGIGEFSRRMKAKGIKVTFVDVNDHNVWKAKSLGIEAHQLDVNFGLYPFRNEQFDGVIMLDVIEHIVKAEFLLEETSRVMKPGGFFILSTPNFAFFNNRLRILFGKLSYDEGYHYRFFTVKTLIQRLRNAGFIVEKTAHTMPAMAVNFFRNRIFGLTRMHIHVPDIIAPLFAQTLTVRARKSNGEVKGRGGETIVGKIFTL